MRRRRRKGTSSELGEGVDAPLDGLGSRGEPGRSSSEPQRVNDDEDEEEEVEPPLGLPPLPPLAPSEASSPTDTRREPHLSIRNVSPPLGAASPVASSSTGSGSLSGRSPPPPTPPESPLNSDGVSEFGIDSRRRPSSATQPGRGHHPKYYTDEELDQEYRAFERACQVWLKAHHNYPQYRLFESIKVRLSDLIMNRWRWWRGVSNYERLAYFEDRKWPNQDHVIALRHRVGPKAIDLTIEDSDDESTSEAHQLRDLEWQDPDEASAPTELNEFGQIYSGDAFINDPQRFVALPKPPPTLEERLAQYQRETARVARVRKREKKRRRVDQEKETTPDSLNAHIPPVLEPNSPQEVPEPMDLEQDVKGKSGARTRARDRDAARDKPLVARQQAAPGPSRTKRRKRIENPRPRRLFGMARKRKTVPGRRSQLLSDRKPLLPQADPAINEFHEYHLFELFEMPLPTTNKTKGAFAMREFALYSKRAQGRSMSDLLLLDGSNKGQFERLEFEGWAMPELETLPESGGDSTDEDWVNSDGTDVEWETRGDRIPHEFDGVRKVVIAASDIVGLVPRLERNTGRPCLYLVTKLGLYRLETPDESYRKGQHLDRARIYINLFVFGRETHVLGQNNRPIRDLVADLMAKLYDHRLVKATMVALERLPSAFQLPKPLPSYADHARDLEIASLLHRHLVNTPFVTPVVYSLVAPFLEPKSLRTDERAAIVGRAQADSTAAVELQVEMEQAILDWWEDNSDPETALEGAGLLREHPDRANGAGCDSFVGSGITVYDCMRVATNVFKAGDTVLVAGTRTDVQNEAEDANAIERARRQAQGDDQEGDWYDDGPLPSFPTKALPAKLWYAKIVYFFTDNDDTAAPDPDIKAHVSWLIPLCDTPLGSLAPKRALYYNDHCSTISATTIARNISIVELDHYSGVPPLAGLYYSLHWDRHTNNYVDSHPVEYPSGPQAFDRCDTANIVRCSSCERRIEESETSFFDPKTELSTDRASWIEDSLIPAFKVGQNTYHLGDYCYLLPLGSDESTNGTTRREPYLLGQLIGVGSVKVGDRPRRLPPFDSETYLQVRALLRYDDVSDKNLVFGKRDFDERRLILTDIEYGGFYWSNLEGTFRLESWKEVIDQAAETFPNRIDGKDTGDREAIALAGLQQRQDVFYTGRGLSFLEVDEDTYWSLARNWVSSACNDIELGEKNVLRSLTQDEIDDIARCSECDRTYELERLRRAHAVETIAREPVRYSLGALSAYSGVDLLSIGLEKGCSAIKTQAAIEQSPYAAAALKANDQKVFNCPTSDYVEALYYSQSVPVQNGDERTRPAPLKRGEVHLIQSGPPCQGFSAQNQYKTQDDVRCLEPFVWLSAVEQYRPLFAVFENVSDIQRFILPRGSEEEAVEKGGLLRLLMSALIQLGYQVRLDIHQAAAFGTPQARRRVILMCARRGLPLPAAPQPTHAFTDKGLKTFAAPYETGTKIHTTCSSLRRGGHAPHHAVTVEEAINDLPSFGFADPFDLTPAGDSDFAWEQYQPLGFRSRQQVLEQDHKAKSFYASKYPKSSFQRSLRVQTIESRYAILTPETSEHVVPAVPDIHASYFANIAKRSTMKDGRVPGKSHNYHDIPLEVTIEFEDGVEQSFALRPELPSAMLDEDKRGSRDPEHFWARLEWTQVISTLLTQLQPAGYWHGPRIHPVDNRQLSVRETARLFGCPDHIKLEALGRADDEDERFDEMYKLIGNAVPVPLAEAIGRELLRVVEIMIYDAMDAQSESLALCDEGGEINFFTATWTKLEAADAQQRLDNDATTCSAEKLVFGGEDSDDSDDVVLMVTVPRKKSKTTSGSSRTSTGSKVDKGSKKRRGSGSQSRSRS